jgi:hypothetical protein
LLRPKRFVAARDQPTGQFVLGEIFDIHIDQTDTHGSRDAPQPRQKRLRRVPAH